MLTAIIVLSVLLFLTMIYTASCAINIIKMHKELDDITDMMERQTQDYAKIVKFQLEQIHLNEEIIKKFVQQDEKETLRNLYELQRSNKIGQA
jgi:ABC-type uncharacterized transport system substrate-binding protein